MVLGIVSKLGRTSGARGSPKPPEATEVPPLVVRNLNKRYKSGTWANRDVDLTLNAGEILGILGPNGAGKTTLVRQITTELLPTSGSVRIMGHDVERESTKVKSLIGVVPQEATLFDYLTVYQHLRIFAKLRGFSPRDAAGRANELVGELRLEEHRNVPIRDLSGGLRRRILIGIAVLASPPLLILDEPTTGLDPQSRQDLWSSLRRYRDAGITILMTTHYMEEAQALCDRVGIILDGGLVALDTVANLRSYNGYEYKITYLSGDNQNGPVTCYGADGQALVEQVQAQGIQDFTLSPTSLEDVYLALTETRESFDDRTD
ncbi:ABC transporter ATP-binding protein [SAR202 cluster bacterium AD-802-F09_MRT_200m]|nr:ABC transporter ATP-binding protein [SAR202 cluster bacterium AD-802-F09_MRT_200m]